MLLLYASIGSPVFAVAIPSFPACVNPQGTVKASYDSGTHGIVGSSAEYNGSDKVYQLDQNGLVQCFCADNGQGIQTNWMKAAGFSDADIQVLKNQGWIYVPTGAIWGLEDTPYLAKNTDYACNGDAGGSSGSSSGSSGGTGGSVLGAATSAVAGLASTGNILFTFGMSTVGLVLFIVGSLFGKEDKYK